jgi:hypothetical protein
VCSVSFHATQKCYFFLNKTSRKKRIYLKVPNLQRDLLTVTIPDSSVSLTMTLKLADVSTEYSKDKDLKKDDVMMLMTWVNKQPHLPEINGEYDSKLAAKILKWYLLQSSKPFCSCNAVTTGTRWPKL